MPNIVNASWLAVSVSKVGDSYSFVHNFRWKNIHQFLSREMTAIPWTKLLQQYQTIIFMLVIAEYFAYHRFWSYIHFDSLVSCCN